MALRWCVLLGLIGCALATGTSTQDLPEAADDLAEKYAGMQATDARSMRFYCLGPELNEEDFPDFFDEMQRAYTWTLLIQYPILSYLDSRRKVMLIDQIVSLVNLGGVSGTLGPLTSDEICIGFVAQYEVTFYRESVLVNIYFQGMRNDTEEINMVNAYFKLGYAAAASTLSDTTVVRFAERNAITINPFNDSVNGIAMNAHPGSTELDDDEDPTMRAVVINSIPGSAFERLPFREMDEPTVDTFIEELMTGTYTEQTPLNAFADNPNPINLFLEGGDIVFIVFGVFFLFLLVVLILTGFCIHPFFLA